VIEGLAIAWSIGALAAVLLSISGVYVLRLRRRLRLAQAGLRDAVRMLEESKAEHKQRSGIDALTGIGNRSLFDEALRREWTRGKRSRQPLAVLMIDIDRFKLHNDTYGHLAGDECLRRVALTLAGCVQRTTDVVARYGGEEFGVILPDTDPVGATAVAERMRQEVESLTLAHARNSSGHDVTVSIGVATAVPSAASNVKDVVAAADRALYTAKAVGRNQVILAESERATLSMA
jgi:diguanylate cyclase (GGDEF)-like protein